MQLLFFIFHINSVDIAAMGDFRHPACGPLGSRVPYLFG